MILEESPAFMFLTFYKAIHISNAVMVWRNSELEELFTITLEYLHGLESTFKCLNDLLPNIVGF